ncbi:MAG: helicase-related protein [Desulfatiglandales bacterium]
MVHLEDLNRGAILEGVIPKSTITVIDIQWHGSNVIELTYKDESGHPGNILLYRDNEPQLNIIEQGQQWNFEADGQLLRLVSEARRICLAYLFDPHLAVHTSLIEPLPHQITAVYGEMLPRQPLKYLLADDPGAGKTIMTGLYIKELVVRGDLQRCLIVCPGNLAEQWQDELNQKFHLPFEILTNDRLESARTGNAFQEIPLMIARLDKLSRDDDARAKLAQSDWDLIVCDEAHKMSASFFAGEIKETKRRKLGKLLSRLTRHFLLLTATPHNGKEEDFQLFMSLLDTDRFEGRFREGVHQVDVTDLMRRMVKEKLLKFDEKPLFPERKAETAVYQLSNGEAALYKAVTDYVREEFNRADALDHEGRKGTVGFALTILQRRLASSPEAILQSLIRRRKRLERRLKEAELDKRGEQAMLEWMAGVSGITEEDYEDLDDMPDQELEELEEEIVDRASAAKTIAELKAEIGILDGLVELAHRVRQSGTDCKWEELRDLLESNALMFDKEGTRRKLIIFTEHRDTLSYLAARIRALLGKSEAVVEIHGGMARDARHKAQELFTQEKDVQILVATDAAGEGINLQRAHLMINYDLPWNPNRIEQRFGRIHRIGQTEVCFLWNLVADETREGDVYQTLLRKLTAEYDRLGGSVFDVLGKAIDGTELRRLMIEAIRYGERSEVRDRLKQTIEGALDHDRLRTLIEEEALIRDTLDVRQVRRIREDMERIEARRLQPHYIEAFFLEAFARLGGRIHQREPRRYEITHVPAVIRARDREIGVGELVLTRYERICFEKDLISVQGKPLAEFVCPGHPLLEAVSDLILERYRELLKQGALLIDENDPSEEMRALLYLEHSIEDARKDKAGQRRLASRRMQFVEIDTSGNTLSGGGAPYLDYRSVTEEERKLLAPQVGQTWDGMDMEAKATEYAISHLVPDHIEEVRQEREERIDKTKRAVQDRLTKEIAYWDHRANELKEQELAGKPNARINSGKARARADELEVRLRKRMQELEEERQLFPLPPVVVGGALIVPGGLLARLAGKREVESDKYAHETTRVEQLAMAAVMATEGKLGFKPRDVSKDKCGYDIESKVPDSGKLRFIEVKGRIQGAGTVTVSKNEILTAFNKPDDFILALVKVPKSEEFPVGDAWRVSDEKAQYGEVPEGCQVRYIRKPFSNEPDFAVTSVNFSLGQLWEEGEVPS